MRFCSYCNKEIFKKYSNKYCDQNCRDLAVLKLSDEKYFAGELIDQKTVKSAYLRHNIEECRICKVKNEWNNKLLVLQLDHIDGNSDNNIPCNLQLLCPNCHSQTETFGCRQTKKNKIPKKTRRNSYLQKYKNSKF